MLHAVKMADGADDILEGLGIPYGGMFNGRDIDGETFTKSTDLCLDWFAPGDRPLLYHHGLDADAQTTVVGRVAEYKATDKGVWTKVQLDRQSEYFGAIKELVEAGKLYFSSGAMAHLVQRKKSGEITRWPWIELSLTPTPANLLAELDFATAEKHFEAAGVKSAKLEELKAMTEPVDATDDEGATDDASTDAEEAFKAAEARLAEAIDNDTEMAPLVSQAARLSDYAALVVDHTKGVHERRIKEGRVLSTANRERLASTRDALEGALKALTDLLAASEPQTAKAASDESVDRTEQIRRRQRDVEVLQLFADTLDPAA